MVYLYLSLSKSPCQPERSKDMVSVQEIQVKVCWELLENTYNKRKICNWNHSCFLLLYVLKVEVTSGIIAVILWSWCNMHRGKTKNCRDIASEPMIAIAMSRVLHLDPYLNPFLMDRATQQSNTNLTHLCIQSFLFPGWTVPNTKFFKLMIFINKQILYI